MDKINIKSIFTLAKTEYFRIIANPRIIVVGMLLAIIKGIVIDPLVDRATRFGDSYNFFEPFIAVCSCKSILLFIPAVFIIIVSDFPDINSHTLFAMHRTGKINWLLGQILGMIFVILTYLLFIFAACGTMMISHVRFSGDWSDVATKFNVKFPDEKDNLVSMLLTSSLYNQVSFKDAVIHTTIYMVLFLLLISLIILTLRILYFKVAGIFAAYLVVAVGYLTLLTDSKLMWIFPTANMLVSKRYIEILSKPIVPIWGSYLYFFGLILFIIITDIIIIKNMNINTMGE